MSLLKHKNGVWYYHFVDEVTERRNAKSTGKRLKSEALKELVKPDFMQTIEHKSKDKVKIICLNDLEKAVMQYVSNNMEKTTANLYRSTFENLIRVFHDKPIKLITTSDIEYFKTIRVGEVSKATVNKDLSTIKAIFNIAIRFDWLNNNPVKNIKKLSIPEKEYLAFTDSQIKTILENIPNESIKNFVKFAIYTGCRLNEIINLQWKDINISERVVYIRNKANFKTKTGKIREIPISEGLESLLMGMVADSKEKVLNFLNPDNYIFTNPKGFKYCKNYITKYFKKILRNLNYEEKYHFHCIRHYVITTMIKSGVNINFVKEIAGHSEISTTMNYIHIATDDLRDAVNKIFI